MRLVRNAKEWCNVLAASLTEDARWTYFWDAENRLTQVVTKATAVAAGATNVQLVFAYDYMSRRVSKRLLHLATATSTWAVAETERHMSDAHMCGLTPASDTRQMLEGI